MKLTKTIFIAATLLLLQGTASVLFAKVRMPKLFGNGMVLQRDKAITIWGWADINECITVSFAGKKYTTKTGVDQKWSLNTDRLAAGGPYEMLIHGQNTIKVSDILIGEVWICSGQSNMDLTLSVIKEKYANEIASANNPNIRQIAIAHTVKFSPVDDFVSPDGWIKVNPQNTPKFSAVGYFFAKKLFEKYKVPIGIVLSSWGGTPAQAWTSLEQLVGFPDHYKRGKALTEPDKLAEVYRADSLRMANWNINLAKLDKSSYESLLNGAVPSAKDTSWNPFKMPGIWTTNDLKKTAGVAWFRKEIQLSAAAAGKKAVLNLGIIYDEDSTFINGTIVGYTGARNNVRSYRVPVGLLREGKNVILIRAVAKEKQGQFLGNKVHQLKFSGLGMDISEDWRFRLVATTTAAPKPTNFYQWPAVLYNGMISPLLPLQFRGVAWYQGEGNVPRAKEYEMLFPTMINDWRARFRQGDFPFLFVQLANFMEVKAQPVESNWAELRNAQTMTLQLPNTGMAVIHDIGDATDIHPQNKLDVGLRLAALADKIAYGETTAIVSGPMFKSMEIKGNEAVITFSNIGTGLVAKGGGELKYFAIAGADQKFVWATAKIKGNNVVVSSNEVSQPVAVRYAWADNPDGANLANKEGYLAPLFRTDKFNRKL